MKKTIEIPEGHEIDVLTFKKIEHSSPYSVFWVEENSKKISEAKDLITMNIGQILSEEFDSKRDVIERSKKIYKLLTEIKLAQ